jgi:hypothetical protein
MNEKKLPVMIVNADSVVVDTVWIVDPRHEYCKFRNELLSAGTFAVVPPDDPLP